MASVGTAGGSSQHNPWHGSALAPLPMDPVARAKADPHKETRDIMMAAVKFAHSQRDFHKDQKVIAEHFKRHGEGRDGREDERRRGHRA
mmetsp:Transcript_64739/g.200718  ORF Transcript_64739/g.200718 Transcript_64739/m.200718 type:complete len:89 (+) Transcript_64739:34-300(+)